MRSVRSSQISFSDFYTDLMFSFTNLNKRFRNRVRNSKKSNRESQNQKVDQKRLELFSMCCELILHSMNWTFLFLIKTVLRHLFFQEKPVQQNFRQQQFQSFQALAFFNAPNDAPKQAMQFGSGIVKLEGGGRVKKVRFLTVLRML